MAKGSAIVRLKRDGRHAPGAPGSLRPLRDQRRASALGALSSAQSHHLSTIVIVGYDASAEAQKAIVGGTDLKADVAQQPMSIGTQTIDAIASLFAGQTPPARIAVPVRIVDGDSVKAMAAAKTP